MGLSALSVILGARFFHRPEKTSYSADIAADLISEPSRGTNLDIAATDQIRPIATTVAIAMDTLRMCIPLACVQLGETGARIFFLVPM